MLIALVSVVVGMVILVITAELMVRSAVGISTALGIPSLIVGLTVVAFGTSAPEMAMSVGAALSGEGTDITTGNIVGSSTSNILVVLGTAALFGVIAVHSQLVRLEVPLLIVVTGGVWLMASNGVIGSAEGVILLVTLVVYTVVAYRLARAKALKAPIPDRVMKDAQDQARRKLPTNILLVVVSLGGLIYGAGLTVDGATDLAIAFGVSELLVGLTVVAVGTSLPELITSVIAVRKQQSDLAVGTILGSNLFNLLGVFGVTAVVGGGIEIPESMIRVDFPVAFLVTLIALPVLASGLVIERWEGGLMLGVYGAYVAYLLYADSAAASTDTARWLLFGAMAAVAALMMAIAVKHRAPLLRESG